MPGLLDSIESHLARTMRGILDSPKGFGSWPSAQGLVSEMTQPRVDYMKTSLTEGGGDAWNPRVMDDFMAQSLDAVMPMGVLGKAVKVFKEPWQMTKKEYDLPITKEPNEVMYLNTPGGKVEVIKNPTHRDYSQITKEVRDKGWHSDFDPDYRFTEDMDGNRWIWKSGDGVHAGIEGPLSKLVGRELSQNMSLEGMSHRVAVRRALYEDKPVPQSVLDEYPDVVTEIDAIRGKSASDIFRGR